MWHLTSWIVGLTALGVWALGLAVGPARAADDNDNSGAKPKPSEKPGSTSVVRPDLQPDLKLEYGGFQNPGNTQLIKFKISNIGTAASMATKVTVVTLVPEPLPWLREIDVRPLAIGASEEIFYPLSAPCNGHKVRATLKYPGDLDSRNDQLDADVCPGPAMPNLDSSRIVDTGLSAVPEHLRKGEHRLELHPALSGTYQQTFKEDDCFDIPYSSDGSDVGFYNYREVCTISVVWQAAMRFDLEMLRQAREQGPWFPTDAVLSFRETPYRHYLDSSVSANTWFDPEGASRPTNTCWLRLAMPTTDWSGSGRRLLSHEIVRESGEPGRFNVFSEVIRMVVDDDLGERGFLLIGLTEAMEDNAAVCRSRIEDVKLTMTYTMP